MYSKNQLLRGFHPPGAAHAEHRVRQPVPRESLEGYAPLRRGSFAGASRVVTSVHGRSLNLERPTSLGTIWTLAAVGSKPQSCPVLRIETVFHRGRAIEA